MSPSTPNLHDFATRTHLARLDIAYEKLDTYVEQSVQLLQSAMNEQRAKIEDWVEKKMSASEEKLATAVATVQQTRSVLDSAVSSLSASGKQATGVDKELRARFASLEERSAGDAVFEAEVRERLKFVEERCAVGSLTDAEMRERFKSLEDKMKMGTTSSPKAGGDTVYLAHLEERIAVSGRAEAEARERLKSVEEKLAGTDADIHERFYALEEQLTQLAEAAALQTGGDPSSIEKLQKNVNEVMTSNAAMQKAIADVVSGRMFQSRTDAIQQSMDELQAQVEALRSGMPSPREYASGRSPKSDLRRSRGADPMASLEERLGNMQAQLNDHDASQTVFESAIASLTEKQRLTEERELSEAADKEARNAMLQAIIEEKQAAIEEKVAIIDENQTATEEKVDANVREVQDLKWRHESFGTNLDSLARRVQELLTQFVDTETQLQELQQTLDEWNEPVEGSPPTTVSQEPQEVQDRLSDYFGSPQSGDNKRGPLRLRILEGTVSDLEEKLEELEQNKTARPDDFVTQSDFFNLRARVEGGFECVVVQMEARRWMLEETGLAGDKIVQQFTLNMDNRISELEKRFHKNDAVVDKLCEKNNIKVKSVSVPAHCNKCGNPMMGDADFCRKCGAPKKVKLMKVPKRAVRAAQEHNYTLMNVCFDLWAHGSNAECLKKMARELNDLSIDAVLSPTSAIRNYNDPAHILNPRAGLMPKRQGTSALSNQSSPIPARALQALGARGIPSPITVAADSTEGSPAQVERTAMLGPNSDTDNEVSVYDHRSPIATVAKNLEAHAQGYPSSPPPVAAQALPISLRSGANEVPRQHNGAASSELTLPVGVNGEQTF